MELTIKLTVEEINAILQVFGDLPTKTGAFPLMMKLRSQAEAQLPPPQVEDKKEEAA